MIIDSKIFIKQWLYFSQWGYNGEGKKKNKTVLMFQVFTAERWPLVKRLLQINVKVQCNARSKYTQTNL